jgi:hypothetical protein
VKPAFVAFGQSPAGSSSSSQSTPARTSGRPGAPFGYASTSAPLLLFYELTEGRSLQETVRRLRDHHGELSMWRRFQTRTPV